MSNGGGRIAALVFIALTCCTSAAAADFLELHARPVISPAAEELSIHDIFVVAAPEHLKMGSPQQLKAVCGHRAALVPLWQLKGLLSASTVENREKRTVSVVGRRSVYIPSGMASPAMQALFEEVLKTIGQEYTSKDERIEVEIPHMPGSLRPLTQAEHTIAGRIIVELLTLRKTGTGKASARFLVRTGDLEGVLSVDILRLSPYLSPPRRVERGEVLQSDDLNRAAFPVGAYPAALFSADSSTYEARAAISAGAPLTIRNARIKPVIEAGDKISVRLQRGAVQLKMPGVARGAAGLNENVAVRLETGIIKEGRVINSGEVLLE